MGTQIQTESTGQEKMLPPPPGTFEDREDLIKHVRDFGANQGYVVTIKKSRKDRRVILGCDRGGVYRNRRKIDESKRKRKACSRLINCPFEAIGRKEDDVWVLTIKNGEHNHEPLKDMSEHPYSRRFSEEEVRQIKVMTEAGIKPRQVLKALKQSNPELQSTPRHLYNLKAKIRQGNLSEKSFKSWRPNRSVLVNTSNTSFGESLKQSNHQLKVPNFIGGKSVDSKGCVTLDVINPATQEVVSQVPLTTYEEFKEAVNAAKRAFPSWKNTPVTVRQHIMFRLQELIRRDIDKLAMNITIEQGKTLKSARSDVLCGLEVVEHACAMATLQTGEFVPNVSNGIDTYCIREPLGVCAGICPFNFPAMVPLWMFPIAVTCGNTFVLKPSEKNPGASMMLAALAMEAGLPNGVLNIVHGTNDIVNYMCDDDDIKALSFIGSSTFGIQLYARAAASGKRVQSNVGGKNYAIIMPDASIDATLNALVATGFGAVGQRSMALSTAVFVGGSMLWEDELIEVAKALKVNAGIDPSADLGPVISKEVKDRISRLIHSAIDSGAKALLDGRNIVVPGYENGNFLGPTILCDVTPNMECCKEEICGPVLLCMQAESLEDAITMVNKNRFVTGASIFTTSGFAARKFQNEIEAGLVGINVPVPAPLSFLSNASKASFTGGDFNFCGKAGVQFYTQIKTVAQQWRDLPRPVTQLPLPPLSDTDIRSQGVSSVLRSSSERESPSRKVSSSMSPSSARDSPSHEMLLPIPTAAERDLPDSGVSSVSPTVNGDLPSRGASLQMPQTAMDLSNREVSLAMPPATETNSSSQGVSLQTSERMYMPQTSHWNESVSLTSQRTEDIPRPSERIYMPATSQRNNTAPTSQRSDNAMALPCDGAYVPTSHKNDNIGSLACRNDSMGSTSHQTDMTLNQTSERIYVLSTSHLNDDMGQTFQRSDTNSFPTTERIYIPRTSHRNDRIGSAPHRTDITLCSNTERLYMSGSTPRNDIAPVSQQTDILPSTSERMYMHPLVQRNAGMPSTSERLYMPAASSSQRMYTQSPILSMDDFPSQGSSMTLPTSQRI